MKEYEKDWKEVIYHEDTEGNYKVLELNTRGFLSISMGVKGDKSTKERIVLKLNSREMLELGTILKELAIRDLLP